MQSTWQQIIKDHHPEAQICGSVVFIPRITCNVRTGEQYDHYIMRTPKGYDITETLHGTKKKTKSFIESDLYKYLGH